MKSHLQNGFLHGILKYEGKLTLSLTLLFKVTII